jgi:hypothetical protein
MPSMPSYSEFSSSITDVNIVDYIALMLSFSTFPQNCVRLLHTVTLSFHTQFSKEYLHA